MIMQEKLVREDKECLLIVNDFLLQLHKQSGESKLVSLGGAKTYQGVVAEVFNSSKNTKSALMLPNLPVKLSCHCSLILENYVYCIGGRTVNDDNKSIPCKNVWRINLNDPVMIWIETAPMNHKRFVFGAAKFRNSLVVAGGCDGSENLASIEVYISAFDEWKIVSPLQQARSGNCLVACDNYLYALGGWCDGKCLSSVERVSELNKPWKCISPMLLQRRWFAAVSYNGSIYCIGGQIDSKKDKQTKTVEKFDPTTEVWTYVSCMNFERICHAAYVVNEKIIVVGGLNAVNVPVKEIECYDPSADSWCIVGTIDSCLYNHSLIAL